MVDERFIYGSLRSFPHREEIEALYRRVHLQSHLARLNRCGEALQIAQLVLARLPANEQAVAEANETINICETNLSVTVTPTLTAPAGTPAATPSPTPVP